MADKQKEHEIVPTLEVATTELIHQQKKLVLMEIDLKDKCDAYDKKCDDLQSREAQIEKREKSFEKKHATLSDSESFGEMVRLIDQVYTLYVVSHKSDKGLYDAIKLLLDARERYNTKLD